MSARNLPAGLILVGEQRITFSNTAVKTLNSTVGKASHIVFSVESANVRMTFGSGNPGRSTGVMFASGATYTLDLANAENLKMVGAVSTVPNVRVAGFKYPGE